MKAWKNIGLMGAIAGGAMVATPGDTNSANAAKSVLVPIGYPFADCGTVGVADSWLNTDGSGEGTCLAWFPDSGDGWAFLVSGLDAFEIGDRVYVDGLICDICLTTCFAGAMLDTTISACEPEEPKLNDVQSFAPAAKR